MFGVNAGGPEHIHSATGVFHPLIVNVFGLLASEICVWQFVPEAILKSVLNNKPLEHIPVLAFNIPLLPVQEQLLLALPVLPLTINVLVLLAKAICPKHPPPEDIAKSVLKDSAFTHIPLVGVNVGGPVVIHVHPEVVPVDPLIVNVLLRLPKEIIVWQFEPEAILKSVLKYKLFVHTPSPGLNVPLVEPVHVHPVIPLPLEPLTTNVFVLLVKPTFTWQLVPELKLKSVLKYRLLAQRPVLAENAPLLPPVHAHPVIPELLKEPLTRIALVLLAKAICPWQPALPLILKSVLKNKLLTQIPVLAINEPVLPAQVQPVGHVHPVIPLPVDPLIIKLWVTTSTLRVQQLPVLNLKPLEKLKVLTPVILKVGWLLKLPVQPVLHEQQLLAPVGKPLTILLSGAKK